ncbi:Cof-type HAD-IIB family hydrolase [Dehalobacter sp. DCM]|uniref:HAD family hydrolase n=1 Tax=Dehalobacter sp. DCM TaxID=2907827 RepID=UPI0030818306|nr:Cof-type HAD-IIB family hydrolase [Dehalobacter sp. DCM]
MTIKLAVFDIDGTLAPTEDPIPAEVARQLRDLEKRGIRIVFISGRTASYLAGLARGSGIYHAWVAGENGGVIFDPASKWEKIMVSIPYHETETMKKTLLHQFHDLWFQPNQTMLTPTPKRKEQVEALHRAVLKLDPVINNGYKINIYDDCVEIMPRQNSKGKALAVIKDLFRVKSDEVIVFGNTVVDLPMKEETSQFVMIGDAGQNEEISHYEHIGIAFRELQLLR